MKKSNVSFIAQKCEIKFNGARYKVENVCFININYIYKVELLT
jgi:hypothetical protein